MPQVCSTISALTLSVTLQQQLLTAMLRELLQQQLPEAAAFDSSRSGITTTWVLLSTGLCPAANTHVPLYLKSSSVGKDMLGSVCNFKHGRAIWGVTGRRVCYADHSIALSILLLLSGRPKAYLYSMRRCR